MHVAVACSPFPAGVSRRASSERLTSGEDMGTSFGPARLLESRMGWLLIECKWPSEVTISVVHRSSQRSNRPTAHLVKLADNDLSQRAPILDRVIRTAAALAAHLAAESIRLHDNVEITRVGIVLN